MAYELSILTDPAAESREHSITSLTALPMLVADGPGYLLHKNFAADLQKQTSELEAAS